MSQNNIQILLHGIQKLLHFDFHLFLQNCFYSFQLTSFVDYSQSTRCTLLLSLAPVNLVLCSTHSCIPHLSDKHSSCKTQLKHFLSAKRFQSLPRELLVPHCCFHFYLVFELYFYLEVLFTRPELHKDKDQNLLIFVSQHSSLNRG